MEPGDDPVEALSAACASPNRFIKPAANVVEHDLCRELRAASRLTRLAEEMGKSTYPDGDGTPIQLT